MTNIRYFEVLQNTFVRAILLGTLLWRPLCASECRTDTEGLIRGSLWAKLNRTIASGSHTLQYTTLNAPAVSQKSRNAMERLVKNGGQGRYVKVDCLDNEGKCPMTATGIRITSPPVNSVYGSAFGEIFEELDAADVPVVITPHIPPLALGQTFTINNFSDQVETIFFMRSRTANIINRHELQHIRDDYIRSEEFMRELPKALDLIIDPIAKKAEAGEKLSRSDKLKLSTVGRYITILQEVRASEASVKSLFTAKGFKDILATRTAPIEVAVYLNEAANAFGYNILLLAYSFSINPKDPYNGIIAAKVAAGLLLIYTIGSSLDSP